MMFLMLELHWFPTLEHAVIHMRVDMENVHCKTSFIFVHHSEPMSISCYNMNV